MLIRMRVYYSSYYIGAAKHLAQLADEIENSHSGNSKFDYKHRSYVTSSILSSVAFMEAAINELYQDAYDKHSSYLKKVPPNFQDLLADFWSMTEVKGKSRLAILDKYQLALRFGSLDLFKDGESPYQEVNDLIQLRNALIHYKPEWVDVSDVHKFEKRLKKHKFAENKLMSKSGNPYYPDKALGGGCANWGVDSAKKFADTFFSKIGVVPNYQRTEFSN